MTEPERWWQAYCSAMAGGAAARTTTTEGNDHFAKQAADAAVLAYAEHVQNREHMLVIADVAIQYATAVRANDERQGALHDRLLRTVEGK